MANFLVNEAIKAVMKNPKVVAIDGLAHKALPVLHELADHIDWHKVFKFIIDQFAKDVPGAQAALMKAADLVDEAEKLLPDNGK